MCQHPKSRIRFRSCCLIKHNHNFTDYFAYGMCSMEVRFERSMTANTKSVGVRGCNAVVTTPYVVRDSQIK